MRLMDHTLLQSALDTVSESVIIVNSERRVVYANSRFLHHMEIPETIDGEPKLIELCDPESLADLLEGIDQAFQGEQVDITGGGILNRRDWTEQITCTPLASGLEGDRRQEILFVIVTASSAQQEDLLDGRSGRYEFQDPVTGLLNRRSIKVVTDREMKRADRGTPTMAMLFVMLRNFKQINQMHGHTVGDLLLENTGIRIRDTIRKSDYVFRWEGTNLVVLLPELATPLDALIVAEKIHSAVTVPYRFRGLDLAPDCHIGISLYPTDATEVDDLFNCANSAVVEAERLALPVLHYNEETHRSASERLHLRTGLQRAFERNELELYYQPIVDRDGVIRGAEALMRWNHPERGLLGPASFIGIAEDSRLIGPIDKLALYNAARSIVAWTADEDLFVTMNISAINITDSSLPVVVGQAIRDAGLTDPGKLKLELTESRTIENHEYSQAAMDELNRMGVDIWIDDFGTGQSSLSYLKHLPVSTVKIDKDFIAELGENEEDIEYLKGIINTIRSRGKRVVIEGVGDHSQFDLVKNLPIDFMQGFYFARPVPAAAFHELVKKKTPLP